jgi:hypothetical protein
MPMIIPNNPTDLVIVFEGRRPIHANTIITRGSNPKYLAKLVWAAQFAEFTNKASPANKT